MSEVVVIYATCPSPAVAEAIAGDLLARRLIACANILPGMTALYVWEGKLSRDHETVMILKTTALLAPSAIAAAKVLHPYTNPAFVVLPVAGGSNEFLAWISEVTAQPV
ncbi:MAG: divalent-cation tolerance protein CutA [Hyphomicrobiaceae bacterium]